MIAEHDQHRRQVDERVPGRRDRAARRHPRRQVDAEAGEDPLEVAAPADRDRHRPDRVLEDQVPADHPGEDLAERRVRVGVGAAGDRNHRGELRVAERGEAAGEAASTYDSTMPGPAWLAAAVPGQHEDAGADDRADAEQRQVQRGQRPLQRLAAVLDVADELLDRLRLQQIRIHSSSGGRRYQAAALDSTLAPHYYLETLPCTARRRGRWLGTRAQKAAVCTVRARFAQAAMNARIRASGSLRRADRVITATAAAPASTTSGARSSVMPPIATTGLPRAGGVAARGRARARCSRCPSSRSPKIGPTAM